MTGIWKNRIQVAACLLFSAGFVYQEITPFFLSVGSILFALSSFFPPYRFRPDPPTVLLMVLWTGMAISGWWSADTDTWRTITLRQLALLLVPAGFLSGWSLSPNQHRKINLFWISLSALFALVTLFRYLINKELVDQALLSSGAIPIWNGISAPWKLDLFNESKFVQEGVSHIYFSVLQSAALLVSALYWVQSRRKIWLIVGIVHLLTLHWFLARTGLIALYFALAVLFLYGWSHSRHKKRLALWGLVILLIPFLSWLSFDAVQHKVQNSLTDLKAARSGESINHRSLAMRMEAWKNALEIIREHPLGVGGGDMGHEMQAKYEQRNSPLWKENRIPPHNQYLETTLAGGLILGLILIALLLAPIIKAWRNRDIRGILLPALLLPALFFESMLQTQLGICMVPFILLFLPREGSDML